MILVYLYASVIIRVLFGFGLAELGRKGKDVLLIGGSYTFAVFITYFLIGILGLNILEVIQQLKFLSIIIKVILIVTGIVVIIFAFYSLYDYYLFKKDELRIWFYNFPKR